MDNGNGEDDARLDIESMEDKQSQLRALEALAFDQEQFEDICRDFNEFCNSIVDINNLKKFKVEYTGIYKALVASHKNEQTYINECKSQINRIWESAQAVKSAIRCAANEVDKIEELKRRVEEETTKVFKRKEESEEKQAQIAALRADIQALERKANEHHELEEDIKLKQLQQEKAEYERLREEQQQRQEALRQRNMQLLAEVLQGEEKIKLMGSQIEGQHAQIRETKEQKEKIEREKNDLNEQTVNLRAQKTEESRLVGELEIKLRDLKDQCAKRKEDLQMQEFVLTDCKATLLDKNKQKT